MIRFHLKSIATTLFLIATMFCSFSSANAQVSGPYVYFGRALNIQHCLQMVSAAGYRVATMGGYVYGIYDFNACFGSELLSSGGGSGDGTESQLSYFDVYAHAGSNLLTCVQDIEFEVNAVRCRVANESLNKLECKARSRTPSLKSDIEFVGCVADVLGPYTSHN
jgi:hypothetical protein